MFDQFNQIILSIVLILYAIFVSFITKKTFDFMIKKKLIKMMLSTITENWYIY